VRNQAGVANTASVRAWRPKAVVLPEVGQRLLDGGEIVLVGPGQLVECGPGQVLERDLLRLAR
jgi:hypothetical protein